MLTQAIPSTSVMNEIVHSELRALETEPAVATKHKHTLGQHLAYLVLVKSNKLRSKKY